MMKTWLMLEGGTTGWTEDDFTLGQEVEINLDDENGNPIKATGIASEVLYEE